MAALRWAVIEAVLDPAAGAEQKGTGTVVIGRDEE